MKKKLLIALLVVAVLVIGIAAVLLANINRVIESQRETLLARARTELGRDVQVGEISASLWPGIGVRVENVTVADDPEFARDPFLSAEAVRVNVRLRPLLKRRVEVKRLVLEKPRLALIRNAQGVLNIDGLTAAASGGATDSGEGAKALPLILAFADVQDGEIRYTDAVSGLDRTVGAIEFTAENVSLDSRVRFQLSAASFSEETDVTIRGWVGPAGDPADLDPMQVPLEVDVTLGPVTVADLLAALPDVALPPDVRVGDDGEITGNVRVGGTVGQIAFEGDLDATGVSLDGGERFQKPAGTPARVSCTGTFSQGATTLSTFNATVADMAVTGSGSIGDELHLRLRGDDLDLSGASSLLPSLAPMALEGHAVLDATIDRAGGDNATPVVAGTLAFSDAGARVEAVRSPIQDANGSVTFTTTSATLNNTTFNVGQSQVALSGQATSLQPLVATYRATSQRALRADFQDPPAQPLPRPDALNDVVVTGTVRVEGPDAFTTTADVQSAAGVLSNIDYTNLTAAVESTGETVRVESYSAQALDGEISGDGTFHPTEEPPRFELTTRTRRVDVAAYIRTRFPRAGDVLQGRVDVDLDLTGAGREWEEIQTTMSGSGAGVVLEGVLLNINLARELVAGVQSLPAVPAGFSQKMVDRNPNLFRENRTAFKNLAGDIRIQNGRVETGNLSVDAGDFVLSGGGWVGFNEEMSLAATVLVSPALSAQVVAELPIARFLTGDDGRLEIPLRIGGRTTRPSVNIDAAPLTQRIQDGLVGEGTDKVKDRLGDIIKGFGKKKN